jgi:dihydroorotate dehydrogenase electron transfer subunit
MHFRAQVVENRRLGRGNVVLRLDGCQPLADAQPGQFVMVRGAWGRDPLLPRAFSLLRTLPDGGCELLVKAIGRGTRLLADEPPGAALELLGPLGRSFPSPRPGDLLVAGGVGLAPLLWHAERARAAGVAVELFYGARSAADLVLLDEIERAGCALTLATEDGSFPGAAAGRVTDPLAARLASLDPSTRVLCCGPNAMMRAVAELARAHSLECIVSVEGEMACGVGVCLGCAVPTVGSPRPYAYACVDGPVFDAQRIVIP